jgi:hypothetical protein
VKVVIPVSFEEGMIQESGFRGFRGAFSGKSHLNQRVDWKDRLFLLLSQSLLMDSVGESLLEVECRMLEIKVLNLVRFDRGLEEVEEGLV